MKHLLFLLGLLGLAACQTTTTGTSSAKELFCDKAFTEKMADRYDAEANTCTDRILERRTLDGYTSCLNRAYATTIGQCLNSAADAGFAKFHAAREKALRDFLMGRISRAQLEAVLERSPNDYISGV